jgi:HEPN domain-containing protein
MDKRTEAFIGKIDELLRQITPLKGTWWSSNMGGGFKDTVSFEAIYTETISLIAAIYGKGKPHYQRVIHFYSEGHLHALEQTEGLLIGTKKNLESGLIDDLKSKVLIDIKTDFLETANNLLNEGEKDPAAVLACIVLEDSLKRLSSKSNLKEAKNKELSVVAGLLYRAGIIEKSTNQSIQNFKNLRNAALHAQWEQVSAESVGLLLTFLPMFFEKHEI